MVVVHPDIATRAPDPALAPRRVVTSTGSSDAAHYLLTAPDVSRPGEQADIVLTAAPLLAARPALPDVLRAARCQVRAADSWSQLLEDADHSTVDVVLVDLDAADRDRRGHFLDMSGHRLVTLLARRSALRHFALMIQTALDFAEVEDLLRLGVHGLVRPDTPDEDLGPHVRAVISRISHSRRTAHSRQARDRKDYVVRHTLEADLHAGESLLWLPGMPRADDAGSDEQLAF
jgi:DNA-binding NarL/FixJ family response regulator